MRLTPVRVHFVGQAEGMLAREAAACAPGIEASFFADADSYPAASASPDLVAVLDPARLHRDGQCDLYALLYRVRERFAGVPLAAWVTDDPQCFDLNYVLPALFDHVFTNDANTRLYYHAQNVHALPPAAALTPDTASAPPPETDVLLCGADDSLAQAVREAMPPGTTVRALENDSDEAAPVALCRRAQAVLRYPGAVSGGERNRMFGVTGSTPDARTFALAEAGVCQVVFLRQPELLDYFTDDEVPTFSRGADLPDLLARLMEDGGRIARAAQARVRREHLYRHRIAALVKTVLGGATAP